MVPLDNVQARHLGRLVCQTEVKQVTHHRCVLLLHSFFPPSTSLSFSPRLHLPSQSECSLASCAAMAAVAAATTGGLPRNYWDLFGLEPSARPAAIRRAFYRLCK